MGSTPPGAGSGGGSASAGSAGAGNGGDSAGSGGATGNLLGCIDAGGTFEAVLTFDNNVATNHGTIRTVAVSSTGQVAVASSDGAVKWWTLQGSASEGTTAGYDAAVGSGSPEIQALAYGPGSALVSGDTAGTVRLWDASAFSESATIATSTAIAAITTDGTRAIVAESVFGGNMRTWTFGGSTFSDPFQTSLWNVAALEFLDDGALVSAGDNYGQPMVELRGATDAGGHVDITSASDGWLDAEISGAVRAIRPTSDGKRLVAAGDGFVVVLDRSSLATPIAIAKAADHEAIAVDVSLDGSALLTAGREGTLRVWNAATGALALKQDLPGVVAMAREPNGDGLIVALEDGHVQVRRCVAP